MNGNKYPFSFLHMLNKPVEYIDQPSERRCFKNSIPEPYHSDIREFIKLQQLNDDSEEGRLERASDIFKAISGTDEFIKQINEQFENDKNTIAVDGKTDQQK